MNAEVYSDSVLQSNFKFAQVLTLYPLAQCQYENGSLNHAIESIKKLQDIYIDFPRPFYFPKSIYLLGKIYEKKGDTDLAIRNYKKFLEMWKDADKDLPDLIEAKNRYKKLTQLASK